MARRKDIRGNRSTSISTHGLLETLEPRLLLSGLTNYYAFEETTGDTVAIDRSFTGNTGDHTGDHNATLFGNPTFTTSGAIEGAMEFDGSDDYITASSSINMASSFTVAAWIKLDTLPTSNATSIVSIQGGTGRTLLAVGGDAHGHKLTSWLGGSAKTSSKGLEANRWYHVALGYDASTLTSTFYVNGQAAGSQVVTGEAATGSLVVGAHKNTNQDFFDGIIDEVRVYDEALVATDIAKLAYDEPLNKQLESHYTFDETMGDPVNAKGITTLNDGAGFTASGQSGDGLVLDGLDDYARAVIPIDPSATDFTAAAYVKLDTLPGSDAYIILNQQDGTGVGRTWLSVANDSSGNAAMTFLGGQATVGNTSLTVGTWHHIAVTYSHANSTAIMYLDGIQAAIGTITLEAADGDFIIGGHKNHASHFFDGVIDDIQVFTQALSVSEIINVRNGVAIAVDPLADYAFEEGFGTQSVNTALAKGTLSNGATHAPAEGRFGGALELDGINGYAVIPNTLDPSTGSFAASLWFNADSLPTTGTLNLLSQFDGDPSKTGRTWLAISQQTGGSVSFSFIGGASVTGETIIETNAWNHLALSYDSTTQKLTIYLNGEEEWVVDNVVPESATGDLVVGAHKDLSQSFFEGKIDDVRTYSRSLTPTDMVNLVPEGDWDKDGLTNEYEKETSRTDPLKRDTDKDTMGDGYEWTYKPTLDPLVWNDPDADSDGDGATDGEEEGPHDGVAGAGTGGGGSGGGGDGPVTGSTDPGTVNSDWYVVTLDSKSPQKEPTTSFDASGTLDFDTNVGVSLSTTQHLVQAAGQEDAVRSILEGTITVTDTGNTNTNPFVFGQTDAFLVGTPQELEASHPDLPAGLPPSIAPTQLLVLLEDTYGWSTSVGNDSDYNDFYWNINVEKISIDELTAYSAPYPTNSATSTSGKTLYVEKEDGMSFASVGFSPTLSHYGISDMTHWRVTGPAGFDQHGTFGSGSDPIVNLTKAFQEYTLTVGFDVNDNGQLDVNNEGIRGVGLIVVTIDELHVHEVGGEMVSVGATQQEPEKDLYIAEDPDTNEVEVIFTVPSVVGQDPNIGFTVVWKVGPSAVQGGNEGDFDDGEYEMTMAPTEESRTYTIEIGFDDDFDGELDEGEISRTVNVYPVLVETDIEHEILELLEENTVTSTVHVGGDSQPVEYTYQVRFQDEENWHEINQSEEGEWTDKARVAGDLEYRTLVQLDQGERLFGSTETNAPHVEVQFPEAATILAEGSGGMDAAWASTLAATSDGSRREEGFWIVLDTEAEEYQSAGDTVGTPVGNETTGQLDGFFGNKPSDSHENPTPLDKPTYLVGWFHTHTPMFYRTGIRSVGASGGDVSFETAAGVGVPGFAYDYTEDAPNSGTISGGHPIGANAEIYTVGGVTRRAAP